MATRTGYGIVKIETSELVRRFDTLPDSFDIVIDGVNKRVVSPVEVGDVGLGHVIVVVEEVDFDKPGVYYTDNGIVTSFDGTTFRFTQQWTPWTQQEIDDYEAAKKDATVSQIDNSDDVLKAFALVLLDEINAHTTTTAGVLAAAAAATSLADFKTRMAAVPAPPPQRTPTQLKTAIRNKMDAP
jgi:hypothetical protein